MKKVVFLSCALSMLTLLVACGGGASDPVPEVNSDPVPEVDNDPASEVDSDNDSDSDNDNDNDNDNDSAPAPEVSDKGTGNRSKTTITNSIVGPWRYTYPATQCVETYEFNANGTFNKTSLDEVAAGTYTFEQPFVTEDRHPLFITFTADNGLSDCNGLSEDNTGLNFTPYISSTRTATIEWFDDAAGGSPNFVFHNQPVIQEGNKYIFVVSQNHNYLNTTSSTSSDFEKYGLAINLDVSQLRRLTVGEMVHFPLASGYLMKVERFERQTTTHLIGFEFPGEISVYRGFVTVGANSAFGRFVTPDGTYELEVFNGQGWVIETRYIRSLEH